MLAAMQSGAGKTVMSCALMTALKKRGLRVQAFKCGPDYIDPMFHSRVLGTASRNLDLFLQGETGVRRSFSTAEGDAAIVEAAMGYYDGLDMSTEASSWNLATTLGLPVILVLRPGGSGITVAAQLRGLQSFRPDSRISGILLNGCSETMASRLKPVLERECRLPLLGTLPVMEEARLESRHLGLLTAAEIEDFSSRMDRLAEQAESSIDLDRLLSVAACMQPDKGQIPERALRCRIAVAKDEAFCFHYEDNLDALRRAGAELRFFSPIHDAVMPEAEGLWLCGGYPELHAGELAANGTMRDQIRRSVLRGVPTVAECGGFLYLQRNLEGTDGKTWPMCGVLDGEGYRTGRLQRFGYLTLHAEENSMLFRAGEEIPAHEFHYWDSTCCGESLTAEKRDGRQWKCGFVNGHLYAAFPHLHFGGALPLAERFVDACKDYGHRSGAHYAGEPVR